MPEYDFTAPRLFVDAPLQEGGTVVLERNQSNYLGNVLRLDAGDQVLVFNGRDGEWTARIETLNRGKATFRPETLLRAQADDTNLWLAFALLKRDTTDLLVLKATELGVAALLPVITERTNAGRVNLDRLRTMFAIHFAFEAKHTRLFLAHIAATFLALPARVPCCPASWRRPIASA